MPSASVPFLRGLLPQLAAESKAARKLAWVLLNSQSKPSPPARWTFADAVADVNERITEIEEGEEEEEEAEQENANDAAGKNAPAGAKRRKMTGKM